jgi:CheY-like chemotaxis protein
MSRLLKILIVEDDVFSQDFYRLFFRKIGGEILIIENADEIVGKIQEDQVDLIIMDINLKNTKLGSLKMDGIRLSRYIKEEFGYLKIPILLVTAYPLSSFGENVLEDSHADDYLVKPIADFNTLIDKINKLVLYKNER